MICQQCGKKNITKAQYCGSCGAPFSQEQREKAYNKTIFGIIEKVEELKGYATLEAVTGHPVFRVAVLVLILVAGLLLGRPHGDHLTILKSDAYQVQQEMQTGEYYVLTEEDSLVLELYFPRKVENLTVRQYRGEKLMYERSFSAEDAIALEKSHERTYVVEADYGDDTQAITLYVVDAQSNE